MTDDTAPPEADRVEGAPHPRFTEDLLGQDAAEAEFLQAFNEGRLHHGWLLTGPRGVGKATLAWKIARFLLATENGDTGLFGETPPPTSLSIDPAHPVAIRIAALSEPRLFLLRPGWDEKAKRLKQGITVDETRRLKDFFHMRAADGGRRVVIVDSADELNVSAANALLKFLEEPPDDVVILLIAHQPARLLPTIRSRCRALRCTTLPPQDLSSAMTGAGSPPSGDAKALAELADGSVGEAVRLSNLAGMDVYSDLIALFGSLPEFDRQKALAISETAVGRQNEPRFDLLLRLIDLFLVRTARTGVSGPPLVEASAGESDLMRRLAPDTAAGRQWAELQQTLSARARHGKAVNLDPAALILDMFFKINELAAKTAAR